MKQSLRKTASHLHLAYKYGQASDSMVGRDITLHVHGADMTLAIDLTPNFHTRNKTSASYQEASGLVQDHHKLKFLQCSDNLVRARLIKAWDSIEKPRMRMCLDLGERGRFLYAVVPHSLFMGGIQMDVLDVLEIGDELPERMHMLPYHPTSSRKHA